MTTTAVSLTQDSEAYLRELFLAKLPAGARVYLFGSRARGDARWNSDFDFWIDFPVDRSTLLEIEEAIEESFVPFNVDLVTTAQLNGRFGEIVKQEARPWL
ncbi:MAG: nucleotidyltransferase domain-containing protein [Azonexus sp.]|nr:nucleotidyltransferase domain-containing protein [Azonexus sp.]